MPSDEKFGACHGRIPMGLRTAETVENMSSSAAQYENSVATRLLMCRLPSDPSAIHSS
jgi:hypothetical protein